MTHTMKTRFCCLLIAAFVSVSMTSCLPGKEEEKKVISQAVDATQSVQASTNAANLSNAANKLLATMKSTTPATTSTSELATVACGTNVVAYIPATSKMAKGGALPVDLGNRMQTELQASAGNDHVVNRTSSKLAGCVTTSLIADNSPVLILEANNASALMKDSIDTAGVVAIDMKPCSGGQPGVTISKTYADGHITKEDKCGTAAPTSLPSIGITTAAMPDYSKRLTGGPSGAVENFKCIVRKSNPDCMAPTTVDVGTKVVCNPETEKRDLLVNPSYDKASFKFNPTAGSRDCGQGWSGELTARVKTTQCKITRADGTEVEPATIYDVAYVGAKCIKKDVVTWGSCPIGPDTTFPDTGHMAQKEDLAMVNVLTLTPTTTLENNKAAQNHSRIGFKTDTTTNMTPEVLGIAGTTQTLVKATGSAAEDFFAAVSDLSSTSGPAFDQAYVTEMKTLGKVGRSGTPTCYAKAQDCGMGPAPAQMELVVDRSTVMNGPVDNPIYQTHTACRATMANLFNANKRHDACQAAKDWQALAASHSLVGNVLSTWTKGGRMLYRGTPTHAANNVLNDVKATLDRSTQDALAGYEATMAGALKMSGYKENLLYGLAVGQDCNPPVMSNGYLQVQEDTYGSCMPNNIYSTEVASYLHGEVLPSCQTSCPGECDTYLKMDTDGKPKPPATTRIGVVDEVVTNTLVPRLPLNANVNYSEMVKEDVTAATLVKTSTTATNLVDTSNKTAISIIAKRDTAGGGDQVPTFKAIDNAIDRLRASVLDANNLAPASIVVFGSKWDTKCLGSGSPYNHWYDIFDPLKFGEVLYDNIFSPGCSNLYNSHYFGRNICIPEKVPTGYNCNYCTHTATAFDRTICLGSTASRSINMSELVDKGMDGSLNPKLSSTGGTISSVSSRYGWCKAHEWDDWGGTVHYQTIGEPVPTYSGTPTYDNDSSMIGFLGKHFPNVKVYYIDMEGGKQSMGELCDAHKIHDPEMPHVFFKDIPVLSATDASADIKRNLSSAIQQATGGGTSPPDIGEKICKDKYGTSVNIDYENVPPSFSSNLTSFNAQTTGQCDPATTYDLGTDTLNPVPAPLLPSPQTMDATHPGDPGDCIKGVKSYLLSSPC